MCSYSSWSLPYVSSYRHYHTVASTKSFNFLPIANTTPDLPYLTIFKNYFSPIPISTPFPVQPILLHNNFSAFSGSQDFSSILILFLFLMHASPGEHTSTIFNSKMNVYVNGWYALVMRTFDCKKTTRHPISKPINIINCNSDVDFLQLSIALSITSSHTILRNYDRPYCGSLPI